MKGKAAVSTLAIIIGFSGYCLAAAPEKVSHQQAAAEAVANRKLAKTLWEVTHQACTARDWPKQYEVMRTVDSQLLAQPTNHLNYSARFVYSSCQQMFLDVSLINGACLNKAPSQYEVDYISKNWKKDSMLCDAEITKPDFSLAEPDKEQSEEEWEAEQRKDGVSDEDITVMKQLRSS